MKVLDDVKVENFDVGQIFSGAKLMYGAVRINPAKFKRLLSGVAWVLSEMDWNRSLAHIGTKSPRTAESDGEGFP